MDTIATKEDKEEKIPMSVPKTEKEPKRNFFHYQIIRADWERH